MSSRELDVIECKMKEREREREGKAITRRTLFESLDAPQIQSASVLYIPGPIISVYLGIGK